MSSQGSPGGGIELNTELKIRPSKLEVAPNALKMLDGVGEWMDRLGICQKIYTT